STPSTLGDALTVGSGIARISRISVIRLTPAANRPVSRAPARPPSASATASSSAVTAGVRRACLLVSPLTCSANITLAHSGDRHRNRADRQADHHLGAADGRVQQSPLIAAVNPAGHRPAP